MHSEALTEFFWFKFKGEPGGRNETDRKNGQEKHKHCDLSVKGELGSPGRPVICFHPLQIKIKGKNLFGG